MLENKTNEQEITVPKYMYAWTIRKERYGEPINAFKKELIEIPNPADDEIIVKNMAAGINYNGVWAALGKPKNVVGEQRKYGEKLDFFIPGSESSGIVCKIGKNVHNVKIGDEVICVGYQCDDFEKEDIRIEDSFRIWGYESNWGSLAEYSKVKCNQCVLKPKNLNWEEAACCIATGGTVYSMLTHFKENSIKKGDVVLIWGGAGGIGSSAIVLTKALGGIPIAVVSNEKKAQECMNLGAAGCINRTKYNHWGLVDEDMYKDDKIHKKWLHNVLKFRKEIWDIVGEKKDPKIVIEHPGKDTLPTSMFLCDKRGMVTICGATTGYAGSLDLRHLWLGIKRLQGSHALCPNEVREYLNLIEEKSLEIPVKKVYSFEDVDKAHQRMYENKIESGKIAILIGAEKESACGHHI